MEPAPLLTTGSAGDLREADYWLFGAMRARSCPLRVLVAGADDRVAARLAETFRAEGRPGAVVFLAPDAPPGPAGHDYIDCDLSADADPGARLRALAGLLAPGGGMRIVVAGPGRGGCDVDGLFDLLAAAGLEAACLIAPLDYDPALLEAEPAVCTDLAFLPDRARARLADTRVANRAFHAVYARRAGDPVRRADPMDPASVPVLRDGDGIALSLRMRPDNRLPAPLPSGVVLVPVPSQSRGMLPLVDGSRRVGDLAAILDGRGVEAAQFADVWRSLFASFAGLNLLLLRAPP
ncbi:hypothetical protein ACLRDC_15160 [Gluconacetobacter sacchari]|uniref:hypothetical protein n=1 Tax=Gluconacetobacter sacchari TaxID=92759 RepID=UPI0039B3E384